MQLGTEIVKHVDNCKGSSFYEVKKEYILTELFIKTAVTLS